MYGTKVLTNIAKVYTDESKYSKSQNKLQGLILQKNLGLEFMGVTRLIQGRVGIKISCQIYIKTATFQSEKENFYITFKTFHLMQVINFICQL